MLTTSDWATAQDRFRAQNPSLDLTPVTAPLEAIFSHFDNVVESGELDQVATLATEFDTHIAALEAAVIEHLEQGLAGEPAASLLNLEHIAHDLGREIHHVAFIHESARSVDTEHIDEEFDALEREFDGE
jgi:hypothetical protein